MLVRLPTMLVKHALLQGMLIAVLLLGPLANLGALQPLDGGCSSSCPCADEGEADEDAEHDEPCEDEQPVANLHEASADDCTADCAECDCDASVATAVTPARLERWPHRIPDARGAPQPAPPFQARGNDIFIPPRY